VAANSLNEPARFEAPGEDGRSASSKPSVICHDTRDRFRPATSSASHHRYGDEGETRVGSTGECLATKASVQHPD
jgi:hypothetical protein